MLDYSGAHIVGRLSVRVGGGRTASGDGDVRLTQYIHASGGSHEGYVVPWRAEVQIWGSR